jgi:hypothetical protein
MQRHVKERCAELADVRSAARHRRLTLGDQRTRVRNLMDGARPPVGLVPIPSSRPSAPFVAKLLDRARVMAGYEVLDLWIDYFALGGNAVAADLQGMLAGDIAVDRWNYEVLTCAINERFASAGFGYPLDSWDRLGSWLQGTEEEAGHDS